jgi:hypothetical protein
MLSIFVLFALRPATRHRMAWGRTAERIPMSVVGYYGVLVGFLMVCLAPFAVDWFGSNDWIWLCFGGFVVFMAGAVFDGVRQTRAQRKANKSLKATPRRQRHGSETSK